MPRGIWERPCHPQMEPPIGRNLANLGSPDILAHDAAWLYHVSPVLAVIHVPREHLF